MWHRNSGAGVVMRDWKDRQKWSGQLRKPALYDRISAIQHRRMWWGLWFTRLFRSHHVWEQAVETDPVIQRCRRIRAKMLAEAYGVEVPTE